MPDVALHRAAVMSKNGLYRYALSRWWGDDPRRVLWVMLNPSIADDQRDDPTIRKCIEFTVRWGYDRMHVVNLFAFRSTDPALLLKADDPVGPENRDWVMREIRKAGLVVAAWGANVYQLRHRATLMADVPMVAHAAGVPVRCLGRTNRGAPKHPARIGYDTPLEPWGPWEVAS